MSLGVKRGTVKIENHNKYWSIEFQNEKSRLLEIFGENCLEIEHIGSTAIPNLVSKPLLDIAIKIKNINNLKTIWDDLIALGYVERVERLSGKQKVFAKGGDSNVTHHLHVIQQDESDWDKKIKFRDILLRMPSIVDQYTNLKRNLADKYQYDRAKYTQSKSMFIRKILKEY